MCQRVFLVGQVQVDLIRAVRMLMVMRVAVECPWSSATPRRRDVSSQMPTPKTARPLMTLRIGYSFSGTTYLRGEQRHKAQREDAQRVRDRHDNSERNRMAGPSRATRPDRRPPSSCRARRERMKRAEHEGNQQAQQHDARRQFFAGDGLRESVLRRVRIGRWRRAGRAAWTVRLRQPCRRRRARR